MHGFFLEGLVRLFNIITICLQSLWL